MSAGLSSGLAIETEHLLRLAFGRPWRTGGHGALSRYDARNSRK